MRLYDDRKDYYDPVLRSAYTDPTPVWSRTEATHFIPNGSGAGPHLPAFRLFEQLDELQALARSRSRLKDWHNFCLLLLCGRAYALFSQNLRWEASGPSFLSYLPRELGIPWPDEGRDIGPDIFRQYGSPIITVQRAYKGHGPSMVGGAEISVNPLLVSRRPVSYAVLQDTYNLRSRFPATQMAQELERYLSNELAGQNDPPLTTGGDKVLRDAKGFDDWSFKNGPGQGKKARRAVKRNGEGL